MNLKPLAPFPSKGGNSVVCNAIVYFCPIAARLTKLLRRKLAEIESAHIHWFSPAIRFMINNLAKIFKNSYPQKGERFEQFAFNVF